MHGMKSRSGVARLGAGAAAFALAATTAVAASAPAAAAEDENAPAAGTSSAYGLNVNASVAPAGQKVLGLGPVGPLPQVESQGERQQEELIDIPASPLLNLKVLNTEAEGAHARAAAKDLKALQEALEIHLLVAKCTGEKGKVTLLDASLAGQELETPEGTPVSKHPAPNTTIEIPPQQVSQLKQVADVKLTLNKQRELDNGGLEVTAQIGRAHV